jgi:hypothetical protein
MKRKRLLILSTACLLIIACLAAALIYKRQHSDPVCIPSPAGCSSVLHQADKPSYKTESSYFIEGTGGYECSKPVKLVSNTVDSKGTYVNYQPVDESEAGVLCHMTSAIEFKGKLKILQKPEVIQLITKYHYKGVTIKAVEFKYIKDKDFVHRLLPAYKDREIGCIIVLKTPNEERVYLEDENLDTFEEMDYRTFEQSLNSVSPADRQTFLENLK